jgi:hypothetical protein
MEAFNIKTASTYVNNLLLSRGLLRDGKPIEFVHPSRAEGGKEATMAHIINLVHDLILKRDVGTATVAYSSSPQADHSYSGTKNTARPSP